MADTDGELFEIALKQVMKSYGDIPIKHESKNVEIATAKIDEGNKVIYTAPLKVLLQIYNEAIAFAPWNSDVLARAFANRSAVLTNGAMYEDSLKDIERVLKIGYPDHLKAKLYARKAKNLLALNNKMCEEVEEAAAEAKLWSEKMDENNKQKIISSLEQLPSQSFKKPVQKWDDSLFMPKMSGENPKILRASDAIDIQKSDKFGRHIVAARDIQAGEAVMIHKAYLATLSKKYWHAYCSNCIKFTFSCVPCKQCSNVVYCDEKCRDEAWNDHHDIECPVIVGLVDLITEKFEMNLASLRIFIKAFKEYSSIEALYKKIKELDETKDSIDKILTQGVFDDTKYASFYGLFRKDLDTLNLSTSTIVTVETLYMLAATTEIFGRKIVKMAELEDIDFGFFVAKLLCHHVAIVRTSSIAMDPYDDEGKRVKFGGVLLPLLSLFSHSCDCNTYQYASGNISAVVSIQPIKKGEQLCINYGIHYREKSTFERREFLMQKHGFWCQCMPCNSNWGPSYRSPSSLMQNRENMKKLFRIVKKYDKFPPIVKTYEVSTRDKSPTDILRTISEICDLLNTFGKYFNYPCSEIENTKHLLLNIYEWVAGY